MTLQRRADESLPSIVRLAHLLSPGEVLWQDT